jgi:hypothetical protein
MNIRKRLTDAWFGVFVVLWCVFIAGMLTITSCVSFSEQKRDLLLENYALVVQEFEAQRVDKVALLNLLKSKTTNPESLDEITLDAEQQAFILEILQLVLPPEDE